MQTIEVISVNFWQMLVALANLLIMFFILKKFLYAPVLRVLEQRQADVSGQYIAAEEAERAALEAKTEYEARLSKAELEASDLRQNAADEAKRHGERIIDEAREKASGIVRQAEAQIELERKQAVSDMKREIAEVSTQLAEKLIEREIDADKHHDLIDSFIDKIGDEK